MRSLIARYKEENQLARHRLQTGSQLFETTAGVVEAALTGEMERQLEPVTVSPHERRGLGLDRGFKPGVVSEDFRDLGRLRFELEGVIHLLIGRAGPVMVAPRFRPAGGGLDDEPGRGVDVSRLDGARLDLDQLARQAPA